MRGWRKCVGRSNGRDGLRTRLVGERVRRRAAREAREWCRRWRRGRNEGRASARRLRRRRSCRATVGWLRSASTLDAVLVVRGDLDALWPRLEVSQADVEQLRRTVEHDTRRKIKQRRKEESAQPPLVL